MVKRLLFPQTTHVCFYFKDKGKKDGSSSWSMDRCFDPERNERKCKTLTKSAHFRSSLFLVNRKLCIAEGMSSISGSSGIPNGSSAAPIEVYDDQDNKWSYVNQCHIPENNFGAVEIEGSVYFISNSFPIDILG